MEKLKICYPIIVEGKYDRLRLLNVVDADIITTDGFGIFKNSERLTLLRILAAKTPLIVITDSDGAGKLIRSHICSAIPKERLIQLYIPRIEGKEKRKSVASAEGTLGVEGMENELLAKILAPYVSNDIEKRKAPTFTKADFFADGLSGGKNSSAMRDELATLFGLPPKMTPNALLAALKFICTDDEYRAAVEKIKKKQV
jgi:ribonuclease M5